MSTGSLCFNFLWWAASDSNNHHIGHVKDEFASLTVFEEELKEIFAQHRPDYTVVHTLPELSALNAAL